MWGAACVVCRGVSATLQAAAFNWSGMMAARFLMGAFEASFAPGKTPLHTRRMVPQCLSQCHLQD